jgi:predicted nucleic acid-binding protein
VARSTPLTVVADTGALYAMIDQSDGWHERVRNWWLEGQHRVVVPVTVLPELAYLLQTRIGSEAEYALVRSVAGGELPIEPVGLEELERAAELMKQYADFPLGMVDSSIVAVAERLDAGDLLTTDRRHFGAIRPRHLPAFTLHP